MTLSRPVAVAASALALVGLLAIASVALAGQAAVSIVETAARSGPSRSRTIASMASSDVPGSVRQSTSTTATPGITLYFTPAWTMFGEIVSRTRALATRA